MLSTLSPQEFVNKWRQVELKERSAAQEHFIDLCRLVGHPPPAEAVLDAYGWPHDPSTSSGQVLSDEEMLERLLALNLERAEE